MDKRARDALADWTSRVDEMLLGTLEDESAPDLATLTDERYPPDMLTPYPDMGA